MILQDLRTRTHDLENLQAIVDAAVAAALAATMPAMPGGVPVLRVAIFARTPAQANAGILNYESNEGDWCIV
jgi:hypothetical protein